MSIIKSTIYFYRLLDIDMVVRDEQGNILDPVITSTIQICWQHELVTER